MAVPGASPAATDAALFGLVFWVLLGFHSAPGVSGFENTLEGPSFTYEPADSVDFANDTGGEVHCRAQGNPAPSLSWLFSDGTVANNVSGLRQIKADGTLIFPRFRAEDYRQDVHAVVYRCLASNAVGTILSRDVQVKGIVNQAYDTYVFDSYVMKDNPVMFRCHIPNFLTKYVTVISWIRDENFVINTTDIQKDFKYLLTSHGNLYIKSVNLQDSSSTYKCRTYNRLTRKSQTSATAGKLFVTEAQTSVPAKISASLTDITISSGNHVLVPCVVQGYPVPNVVWTVSKSSEGFVKINNSNRITLHNGVLEIKNVIRSDSGIYKCTVSNSLGTDDTTMKLTVTEPMQVKVTPKVLKANVGQKVSFICKEEGFPISFTSWLKDGKLLNASDIIEISGSRLTIKSIDSSSKGMYQCIARNETTTVQDAGELQLGDYPPEFLSTFQSQILYPNSRLSLQCTATGNPAPTLSWFRDGIALRPVPQFPTKDGTVMSWWNVSSVIVEDGGVYTCNASNHVGTKLYSSRIHVYGKLASRKVPKSTFVSGENASLHCPIYGFPIDSYIWRKDGAILPINVRQKLNENGTLRTEKIQRTDNGIYVCQAKNNQGETATATIEVEVLIIPKIIPFAFQEDIIREGVRARIHCAVSEGDLPLSIQWMKDRLPISSNLGISIRDLDEFSSILTIAAVSPKHNGNYTCIASNRAANATYTTSLSVNVPPNIVPFSFPDDHLFEGMLLRVSCVVGRGDLPLSITWLKDGFPIPLDLAVSIRDFDEYSSVLSIGPLTTYHTGNYTCRASNHAGLAMYTGALIVNVPPQWVVEPKDSVAMKGRSVSIPCQAQGYPKPQISWMKVIGNNPSGESKPITSDEQVRVFENGTLHISHLSELNQGYYACIASNGIGDSPSKVIHLRIRAPVYFKTTSTTLTVKSGERAVLRCEAFGDLPITFSWIRNEQVIEKGEMQVKENSEDGSSISELTLLVVTPTDGGQYTCSAKNNFGNHTTNVVLRVQESPSTPEILTLSNLGNRSVEITWNHPFDGLSPINKFHLQYKRKQDSWQSRSQLLTFDPDTVNKVIRGLQPATIYEFRVAAENEVGISGYSNVVTVSISEEAPTGAPEKVEVEATDPQSLRISWKPPKKSFWNGVIRGYYVGYKVHSSTDPYMFATLEVPEDYTEDLIYQLTDLKMYTQYSIIVQAYNNGGRGPSSDEIIIMTSENVPSDPPQEVRCSSLSAHSIYVIWEPPPRVSLNGILRGYKVFYKSIHEWHDGNLVTNITDAPRITLSNLDVSTNYSIQVLAFTKVGDGVRSDPIYCKTYEDVPGAPDVIKALPSSSNSIIVSWKQPKNPNGAITKYNIYYKPLGEGEEANAQFSKDSIGRDGNHGANVHTIDSEQKFFEIKGLKHSRYAFWVTATSSIGEGPTSDVVVQVPVGGSVPATAATFDEVIKTHWKKDIVMNCRAVGVPLPSKHWTHSGFPLDESDRVIVRFDGSLVIKRAEKSDSGNYSCVIENIHGRDKIQYFLTVLEPPKAPAVEVLAKSLTSIRLKWKIAMNDADSLKGYILNYKREFGHWQKKELPGDIDSYTLDNLACGATYQLFLQGVNHVGVGATSEMITVTTNGEVFMMPPKENLIREGSTYVTIHLDGWPTTGCPIQYFIVEYKQQLDEDWTMVNRNIKPSQRKLVIPSLSPASWYLVRITAFSSGGETNIAEYIFSTLTATGATVSPEVIRKEEKVIMFYLDPWIFIPVVVVIIVIIISSVVVFIVCRRRQANIPADWTQDAATMRRIPRDLGMSVESFVHFQRTASNTFRPKTNRRRKDNPNPYATSRLPGCHTETSSRHDRSRGPPIPPFSEGPVPTPKTPRAPPGRREGNVNNPFVWSQSNDGISERNQYPTAYGVVPSRDYEIKRSIPPEMKNNPPEGRREREHANQETTFTFPENWKTTPGVPQTSTNEENIYDSLKAPQTSGRRKTGETEEDRWLLETSRHAK